MKHILFSVILWAFLLSRGAAQPTLQTQVLVIGGGTAGTAAAIQAARSGARTLLAEPTHMLGGMLTAAGVSCTDGNDSLPSGLWQEFREALYQHYHTRDLGSGWVSETCFEPHVGDSIFRSWTRKEKNLQVHYGWQLEAVLREGKRVTGARFVDPEGLRIKVLAQVTIDATELGDAMAAAGAAYDLGTEDSSYSHEPMAPGKTDVIQDLTWVAVLKDYGKDQDRRPAKPPPGYRSQDYDCCCTSAPCQDKPYPTDARGMLDYGKLPFDKYMINWPAHGNDFYYNGLEDTTEQRRLHYDQARIHTLGFVYYIQTVLGFKNMGLAEDELDHGLAMIPYNREGRRLRGVVRLSVLDLMEPYRPSASLYRTAIAVGDYPVDHHHGQNPKTPNIEFPKIPSFSIPLGCLIPRDMDGFLVTEKGISVSNIVNGATRLQPVVLLTGQAAGMVAARCARSGIAPRKVSIRSIQDELLKAHAWLLPFVDVPTDHPAWASIQRIGVTGILEGRGKPQGWANRTFFDPDSLVDASAFCAKIHSLEPHLSLPVHPGSLMVQEAVMLVQQWKKLLPSKASNRSASVPPSDYWEHLGLGNFTPSRPILRWELALLVDQSVHLFYDRQVGWQGWWLSSR